MDNNTRFSQYIRALQQYTSRKNNAEVSAQHIEILDNSEIRLGAWVSYMRQRRKNGKLPAAYVEELMKINGWTWGPLRRGPRKKNERNAKILEMRSTGHSITQISDAFNISRQRVHQIVKSNEF